MIDWAPDLEKRGKNWLRATKREKRSVYECMCVCVYLKFHLNLNQATIKRSDSAPYILLKICRFVCVYNKYFLRTLFGWVFLLLLLLRVIVVLKRSFSIFRKPTISCIFHVDMLHQNSKANHLIFFFRFKRALCMWI